MALTKNELKWATVMALTTPPRPRAMVLLPSKLIRQNGVYYASADNADGYRSVTVDVRDGVNALTASGILSVHALYDLGPVPPIPAELRETKSVDAVLFPTGEIIDIDIGKIPSGLAEVLGAGALWDSVYLFETDVSYSEDLPEEYDITAEMEVIVNG